MIYWPSCVSNDLILLIPWRSSRVRQGNPFELGTDALLDEILPQRLKIEHGVDCRINVRAARPACLKVDQELRHLLIESIRRIRARTGLLEGDHRWELNRRTSVAKSACRLHECLACENLLEHVVMRKLHPIRGRLVG